MPKYVLTYFKGRGRAEGCRLLFALAGVEYEDKRVEGEEWAKLKPNTVFGQLPMLEIDGVQYAQSRAILTYLAREFKLYGKNSIEMLEVDQVLSVMEDFFQAAIKMFFAPEDKKEELTKDFKEVQMPKFLGWLEKLLTKSGTGYFVGDKVTVADVLCFDFVSSMQRNHEGCLDKYPQVKGLVDKVANLDNIKAWLEKRPVTQF